MTAFLLIFLASSTAAIRFSAEVIEFPFDLPAVAQKRNPKAEEIPEFRDNEDKYATLPDGTRVKCCCHDATKVCRKQKEAASATWRGCDDMLGPNYHSHTRLNTACTRQPSSLRHAVTWLYPKFMTCANTSVWRNVVDYYDPDDLPGSLTGDLLFTVQNPITSVDQRDEGLCSVAGVVLLMVVAFPAEYLDMMHHIFCAGNWISPFGFAITTQCSVEERMSRENQQDFLNTDLHKRGEEGIRPIDWMAMTAIRNKGDIKVLGKSVKLLSVTKDLGQGGRPDLVLEYLKGLLGTGKRLLRTAPGLRRSLKTGRPTPDQAEWATVLETVAQPLKVVALSMQVTGDGTSIQEFNDGFKADWFGVWAKNNVNHFLILLAARDGICVTWTWAKLLQFPCEDLRLRTEEALEVDFGGPSCDICPQPDEERVRKLKAYAASGAVGDGTQEIGLEHKAQRRASAGV